MSGGVMVHCPTCGVVIMLCPQVNQVARHGHDELTFYFSNASIKHKCEGR